MYTWGSLREDNLFINSPFVWNKELRQGIADRLGRAGVAPMFLACFAEWTNNMAESLHGVLKNHFKQHSSAAGVHKAHLELSKWVSSLFFTVSVFFCCDFVLLFVCLFVCVCVCVCVISFFF